MNSLEYLNKIKRKYNILDGEKKHIESLIDTTTKKLDKAKEESLNLSKTLSLLNETSNTAREKAKHHLEKIVTSALQYVHEDSNSKFEIELSQSRGVPSAEFYIVSEVNGQISRQKPTESCGGGFVDVISATLRNAYLKAFNDPCINNAVLLDEPGRMVSEEASIKFAQFIKELSVLFDKQIIMITHNDSLKTISDNDIKIQKVNTKSDIVQDTNINKEEILQNLELENRKNV